LRAVCGTLFAANVQAVAGPLAQLVEQLTLNPKKGTLHKFAATRMEAKNAAIHAGLV
jgi:hypothetical protein